MLSEVCENYTKSREKTLKSIKRISLGAKFHSFYLKINSSTYNDVWISMSFFYFSLKNMCYFCKVIRRSSTSIHSNSYITTSGNKKKLKVEIPK